MLKLILSVYIYWLHRGHPVSVKHNIYIYIYIYIYDICVCVCAHPLNAPRLYIKNWPEDGSLEPKHVANYVLMIIYMLCLT